MPDYLPRLVDPLLDELLADHPAVLVVGPRACGKTTTGRRHCRERLRLDRPAEAAAVRADADAALADGPFPLLVDEWQVVPEVLGAVKRAVDEGATAGSFVLTGSSQADLTAAGWPATGRLIRVPMYGLAERELEHGSSRPPVLDRLVSEGAAGLSLPPAPPDVRGYVARALRGGSPEAALAASERASRRWLASYVDQLVSRDVSLVGAVRDPMRLRHYLQAIAASTGGTPTLKTLLDAAGIERPTANAYDALLERLLVTERIPSWSSNRLNRLIRLPKRYLVDPAFTGPLLGVDARAVLRDGDLLGRLLDSFVMAQLRAECTVSELSPRLFHVRDANGRHEVDILVELGDGRLIGIEVKADSGPGPDSARHLRWLRDAVGNRFAVGLVLHTGPRSFRLDESIAALPICALWGLAVRASTTVRLALLAVIWGSSFLWIKVALRGLSPVGVTFSRLVLGAAVLFVIAAARGHRLPRSRVMWAHIAVAAVFANAAPYLLFSLGEQHVGSATAGILNATTPLWTIIVALATRHERSLPAARAAGLIVGFAGALLVFAPWQDRSGLASAGAAECVVAALCYGISYVYMDKFIARRGVSPVSLSACQLLVASVVLGGVLGAVGAPSPRLTAGVLASIAVLGLLGTGLAYVLNYQIISSDGATTASTVTYLLPVVAIILGAALLGEKITVLTLAGIVLILAGVALTRRRLPGLLRPPALRSWPARWRPRRRW